MGRKAFDAAVVDLAQSIGMLVRRARAVAATDELSWTETAVLRRLAMGGSATTAELARVQEMKPQSMRTVVASLEEMGMVERSPHATDGRQVNLELTAKGMAAQKLAGEVKRTWLAQAVARLDAEEQETLFEAGRILRRIVEGDRG
ncbi:MAG: MarR family transcriptional regulator [Acidobacteria bacterium]|nr:MarR family transcriptional regulator [Acidobacteriota bacterium]